MSFSWLSFGTKQPLSWAAFSHLKVSRRDGLYDRMILVSNDSDAQPALDAIREDFSHIMLGVVMPIRPVSSGAAAHRRPSGSLANQADWTIAHLGDDVLDSAQLPSVVPTKKKPIRKPAHW